MLRVQAVLSGTVACNITWTGCKSDQSANWRVHLCQPHRAAARSANKWVVPAGIQNHDVGGVARSFHFVQHGLGVYRAVSDLVFPFNVRANGY